MGITNITSTSDIEYQTLKKTTKSLVDKIKNQKDGSSANLENSSNQQEKFKSSTEFYDKLLKNLRSKKIPAQLKGNDSNIRQCFNMVIIFTIKRRKIFFN